MGKEAVLPKNVRQIGDIQGNRRIYMEDYVMTYIHRKEQQEEKGFLGVFLGESQETEEGSLLFIRGLVEVPGEEEKADADPETEDLKRTADGRRRPAGDEYQPERGLEQTDAEAVKENGAWETEPEESGTPGKRRTVIETCREYFGPSEIQGCCVIGEYPVKRMERLAKEIPRARRFLYHLQEQEETLYWTEEGKYGQISGYFVFYEQNRAMQDYMSEVFGEEQPEQDRIQDKAIRNFREKIRKKDQIRTVGMLKLASSFFVVMVLVIGAVVVNRIGASRDVDVISGVPENEAFGQLPQTQGGTVSRDAAVTSESSGGDAAPAGTAFDGTGGQSASDESVMDAAALIQRGIGGAAGDSSGAAGSSLGLQIAVNGSGQAGTDGNALSVPVVSAGSGTSGQTGAGENGTSDQAGVVGDGTSGQAGAVGDGTSGQAGAGENGASGQVSAGENGASGQPGTGGSETAGQPGAEGSGVSGGGPDMTAAAVGAGSDMTAAASGSGSDMTTVASGTGSDMAVTVSGTGSGTDDRSGTAGVQTPGTSGNASDTRTGIQTADVSGTGNVTDGSGTVPAAASGARSPSAEAARQAGLSFETGANGSDRTAENGSGRTEEEGTGGAQAGEDDAAEASSRQIQAAYVIREGDTLADICQKYYGGLDRLEEICEANEITDADMIMPGQKIVLP